MQMKTRTLKMNKKQRVANNKLIVKKCAFCGTDFYAKRISAVYCSDTCKEKFYLRRKNTPQWYSSNPNEGNKLPPGTITSWVMPESKLVYKGDILPLYRDLSQLLSKDIIEEETEYIQNLRPYSETNDWQKSSVQIFTDEYFMEVFRIFQNEYKLYMWPWGDDNEKPFI